jgi:hypothetical protein
VCWKDRVFVRVAVLLVTVQTSGVVGHVGELIVEFVSIKFPGAKPAGIGGRIILIPIVGGWEE